MRSCVPSYAIPGNMSIDDFFQIIASMRYNFSTSTLFCLTPGVKVVHPTPLPPGQFRDTLLIITQFEAEPYSMHMGGHPLIFRVMVAHSPNDRYRHASLSLIINCPKEHLK